MSTKHNTRHQRGRSHYKAKVGRADRYGQYRDGVQVSKDHLNVAPGQPRVQVRQVLS
jgi:hypothetical protein